MPRIEDSLTANTANTDPLIKNVAGVGFFINNGTPEGAITAPVGSYCTDSSSGTLYTKQTGSGNTGWAALGGGSLTRIADVTAYPATPAVGASLTNITKDQYERFFLCNADGSQGVPLLTDREQMFSGILRPVDDGGGNVSGWEFIQDTAHFGGEFLEAPTMDLVGETVEMNWGENVQIDKIRTGVAIHDGQFSAFQPGISINVSRTSVSIFEMSDPWYSFQARLDTLSITSHYEVPRDRATGTTTEGTGFDPPAITVSGNEVTFQFANESYRGWPIILPEYNGTLFHAMMDYQGAATQPQRIVVRLFDAAGAALTTIPGNTRLNVSYRVNREQNRTRVAPNDARLLGPNSANFWLQGRVILN